MRLVVGDLVPSGGSGGSRRVDAACLLLMASIVATWTSGFWNGLGMTTLLGAAAVGSAGGIVAGVSLSGRLGPLNLLRPLTLAWVLVPGVLAVDAALGLAQGALFAAATVGGALTGFVAATLAVLVRAGAAGRSPFVVVVVGAIVGGAALVGVALVLGFALVFGLIAFASLVAGAVLRRLVDPLHPHDPLRRFAAWGDGSGRRAPPGWRRVLAVPATVAYLALSWALFLSVAEVRAGILQAPEAWVARWGYQIPVLTEDPLLVPRVLLTAPLVNHDIVQMVYVSLLLLFFGVPFELREGTGRFLALFFGIGGAAALIAGGFLHLVYPDLSSHPVFAEAWRFVWTGGSVGAFAIMGAFAARAPDPWPLLVAFIFWEVNVGWWFLRSYTPAFHLTALLLAFGVARRRLPPRPRQER